jgi:hypothetical protein
MIVAIEERRTLACVIVLRSRCAIAQRIQVPYMRFVAEFCDSLATGAGAVSNHFFSVQRLPRFFPSTSTLPSFFSSRRSR